MSIHLYRSQDGQSVRVKHPESEIVKQLGGFQLLQTTICSVEVLREVGALTFEGSLTLKGMKEVLSQIQKVVAQRTKMLQGAKNPAGPNQSFRYQKLEDNFEKARAELKKVCQKIGISVGYKLNRISQSTGLLKRERQFCSSRA